MSNTTPPEPAAAAPAQAMALEALQSWARNRDRLPDDRATLVALAWHTGARNIRELARLADVSRDTIYADLRARGIDAGDRAAVAAAPTYQPLTEDAVAGLGDLVQTRVLPAMIGGSPEPLALAAWSLGIAIERIAQLLTGPRDAGAGEPEGESRTVLLEDLVARCATAIEQAQTLLAEEFTDDQLAAYTEDAEINALEGGLRPVVDRAELRLTLPNDAAPALDVTISRSLHGILGASSDSPLLTGRLARRAHLSIAAAFDVIAREIEDVLAGGAFPVDTAWGGDDA